MCVCVCVMFFFLIFSLPPVIPTDQLGHLRDQVTEYPSFVLAVREGEVSPQMYRNPFDIPRSQLLDQLTRMRANFLQVGPLLVMYD